MDKILEMKNRLAAIVAQLNEYKGKEDHTEEDVQEIEALSAEFETLSSKITAAEKLEAITAKTEASSRKVAPATPRVEVTKASQREEMMGFSSPGEFFMAVKNASHGTLDKRFQNTHFERSGEDGGFLVPETMLTTVSKKLQADESLFNRTRQFTVSGNSLSLPTDETSPWNGGVQAYWVAEGAQIQDSKHKFGMASWKLSKLAALVKVTDELLEDATALQSYILQMAPEAIMHKVNSSIISGDGVGKPTGILNSGFKIKVPKEAAQTADTIVYRNVIKMYNRMIPAARAGAVWYINPMIEDQLRTIKDDEGNFMYLAPGSQLNQTPYGLLLGLPVLPLIGSMPALGDEGDIILANLNYYYTLSKVGGMKQSVSQHLYFDKDIQAFKFTMRLDGKCPFTSPIKTEFGNYEMSAIITLEDRA